MDGVLADLREKLEALERRAAAGELLPNWDALNLARSYVSNTLKRDASELSRWQSAVSDAASRLAKKEVLDLSTIEHWNRILLANDSAPVVRDVEQSLVGRRLLACAEVPAALGDFESDLLAASGEDPVVRASRIYQWLITIHPFLNANGRTARLAADYVLIEGGYLPAVFPSPLSFSVALFPDRPRQVKPIEAFRGTALAVERALEVLKLAP